jgi:hypothetical protein
MATEAAPETILDPLDPGRRIPHEPWMTRFAMWAYRGGVLHVVVRAADVGVGIAVTSACGVACHFIADTSTWFYVRSRHRRLCRECLRRLAAAGEAGPLAPPPRGV